MNGPKADMLARVGAQVAGGLMWWWVLWHLFHEYEHITVGTFVISCFLEDDLNNFIFRASLSIRIRRSGPTPSWAFLRMMLNKWSELCVGCFIENLLNSFDW